MQTHFRLVLVWLVQMLKAATNVRRAVPDWATESITIPPASPLKLCRNEPHRLMVTIRETSGQPVMLSPRVPSTMSGQGSCLLPAFGERIIRTTGEVYAVSTTGAIVDVTRS